jgi:hypothetical protein
MRAACHFQHQLPLLFFNSELVELHCVLHA